MQLDLFVASLVSRIFSWDGGSRSLGIECPLSERHIGGERNPYMAALGHLGHPTKSLRYAGGNFCNRPRPCENSKPGLLNPFSALGFFD